MSSSMFIEPKEAANGVGIDDGKSKSENRNSNLVVVYGKNGVNIDPKDLETLIEEKAVQTISVIRITSPTPSMEEAEEIARVEAAKEAEENNSDDSEEGTDGESTDAKRRDTVGGKNDSGNAKSEDEENSSATEENDENQNESSGSEKSFRRSRRRKTSKKKQKSVSKKKDKKEHTEVMGLTLEGFYEADAALQIAKEACKMAGIPYIRNTAEHEFMLFVIRNDHSYTPYTSPEQMKAKLMAEKLEAEKLPFNTRRIQPQFNVPPKQLMAKTASPTSKPLSARKPLDESRPTKEKSNELNSKQQQQKSVNTTDENLGEMSGEDENETFELIDVDDSDFTGSEDSADSDNDRDSDADFNLSGRKTKKRKLTLAQKKARRSINAKLQERRLPSTSSQDEGTKPTTSTVTASSATSSGSAMNSQRVPAIKTRIVPKNYASVSARQVRQPQMVRPIPPPAAATTTVGVKTVYQKSPSSNPVPVQSLRPGQIISMSDVTLAPSPRAVVKSQTPTQPAVKEIVINKVLSSPKGCFTELTTLISEAEKTTTPKQTPSPMQPSNPAKVQPSTPPRNVIAAPSSATTPSRTVFTRIDGTDANSTLPARISVETHQSSSELAAEHDKQLDLIDSIVNDELNKTLDNLAEQSSISTDENIPKIVQMLENTEQTLTAPAATTNSAMDTTANVNNNNNNNNTSNVSVDDIDISHDLPEDLLQHVVELIKDDKTLQEAVEKEILEQENSFASETTFASQPHSNDTSLQTTPSSSALPTSSAKSIIQMSISNTTIPSSPVVSTPNSSMGGFAQTSPLTRREPPIQIVRGNGRVITLPPIEAPTTRAKRRAQVVPGGGAVGSSVENSPQAQMFNESSLDGSLQSNASFVPTTPTTTSVLPAAESVEKKSRRRRNSKEGGGARSSHRSTSNKSKRSSGGAAKQEEGGGENSDAQADDDDPKKLWCICRQPHNNRFMICCDSCGDWFHGTCVNVTKAMGREMELKGLEWACPQCAKKREEKTQPKLTEMFQVSRLGSQASTEEKIKAPPEPKKPATSDKDSTPMKSEGGEAKKPMIIQQVIVQTPTSRKAPISVQNQRRIVVSKAPKVVPPATPQIVTATPIPSKAGGKPLFTTPVRVVTSTPTAVVKPSPPPSAPIVTAPKIPCVFCKKPARPNTLYCSDDCIRRCAQNAINVYTAKSSEQDVGANSIASDDKRKKGRGLFEDVLSMADRKPKVERIVVYERKSGTKLSGSNAPTTLTIRKWLHDNPTFEIVLPGSQLSVDIEKQQAAPRLPEANKHTAQPHPHPPRAPNLKVVTSTASSAAAAPPHKPPTLLSPDNQKQITSTTKESGAVHGQPTVTKSIHATPSRPVAPSAKVAPSRGTQQQHVPSRPDNKSPRSEAKEETKTKERQLKRQSSDVSSTGSSTSTRKPDPSTSTSNSAAASTSTAAPAAAAATSSTDNEPIRRNVRRTLREQITQRMNEASQSSDAGAPQLKLTPGEVDAFVKETEEELFNMFNRDTGSRYKAKYRSLIFNIKDRKNHTLFAKICAKQIEPKQLVHMSPEELASQELAQWRQNENKHQLEMIKKSELDLLSCTKNFLFKNHKGEEVIESKESAVCVNLDMTIPVEDVVNVLNNSNDTASQPENDSEVSSAAEGKGKQLSDEQQPHKHIQDQEAQERGAAVEEKALAKHQQHPSCDAEKERSRDRRHRSKSRESEKEKERDREREKERDRERRRRSRSKDVERDRERRHRSRERHHHHDKSRSRRSRSRSDEKRSKSSHKERERERDREKDRERDREKDRERDREKDRERDKNKEKKASSSSSNASSKPTAVSQIHSKEKQRHSPISTGSGKPKPALQQQKSKDCFNLIDQIIESSKTVEEAANLVHEKAKDKDKEKHKEQQSPVIATSSTTTTTTVESAAPPTVTTAPQPTQPASSTGDSDQEPSSTVSIPTPPRDPYAGEEDVEPSFSRSGSPNMEATQLWFGGLSMNDVAALQMKLYHLIGNTRNLGRLLAESLDVVGRIDGETVWEYLWKIRKSPNKEIVLIRLAPYSEDDTDAYASLFKYLDKKKRLGVIKSITPQIKDFYIYPLGAGKHLPKVLQVTSHDDFYNDPYRPDMIIGIIVRVLGKRTAPPPPPSGAVSVGSAAAAAKTARRSRIEADSFTPPGSPKRRKHTHKGDLDLDSIIKGPMAANSMKRASKAGTDADEPYSPGGSSEDDALPQYSGKRASLSSSSSLLLGIPNADEDLKRKMEEINRQIAAQEMEIAGLLNVEPNASGTVLANISIPANLPQILASIKSKDTPGHGTPSRRSLGDRVPPMSSAFGEYNPEDVAPYNSNARHSSSSSSATTTKTSTSRLAQLSEAELLSMVPDDILLEPAPPSKKKKASLATNVSPYYHEPPPPGI